jgi:hypothetical protein
MIKIAVCESAPWGGCSFYRSLGVLHYLRKINPDIQITHLPQISWDILAEFDILFVARPVEEVAHLESMKMARQLGLKIWIDYDDCLHELPEDNPGYEYFSQRKEVIEGALKMADVVTVSVGAIKDYYKDMVGDKEIIVIENAFNDYMFQFDFIENNVDIINWRGSATHRQDLLSCTRGIHAVAAKYPKWGWTFAGNDIWFVLDGIPKARRFNLKETDPISYHQFIQELQPAITINPLLDTVFTRNKSNITWIEATYSGAAALVPDIPEFCKPGAINYKAEDNDNFVYYLEKMINSKKFRRDHYEESYSYIKENLMLSKINQKRINLIEKLITVPREKPFKKGDYKIMKFKESELAHKYCKGNGVELGAASHNPFNLEDCVNVAPQIDEKFYSESQVKMGEKPQVIDLYGTADNIPVEDHSIDYVISSHVVEHVPDLIGAFLEWNRALKDYGIIFIIAPKRDALPSDIGRPLSKIEAFEEAHVPENKGKVDTDNHIWVFSITLMVELVNYCNEKHNLRWEILEALETDDKVGNGMCMVCRKRKS